MAPGDKEYESEDDREDRLEAEREDEMMTWDPYSDDEKEQMGSQEFFNDNE